MSAASDSRTADERCASLLEQLVSLAKREDDTYSPRATTIESLSSFWEDVDLEDDRWRAIDGLLTLDIEDQPGPPRLPEIDAMHASIVDMLNALIDVDGQRGDVGVRWATMDGLRWHIECLGKRYLFLERALRDRRWDADHRLGSDES